MPYIKKLYGLIVLSILLFGCEKEVSVTSNPENLVVVEGYLYAGQPVEDIRLTSALAYGSSDTTFESINDAEVIILWNDKEYSLEALGDSGKYCYNGKDLDILAGESYQLQIEYEGETFSAETTVPPKTDSLTISQSTISIDEDAVASNPFELFSSLPEITLNWSAEAETYYYVLVKNVEDDPESIDFGFDMPGGIRGKFRFMSSPFMSDSYRLMPQSVLEQYGTHYAIVYRVNEEYANLYETREQDSRSLNEPYSNIENGLGIFTAFNSDSVLFEVKKD